MELVLHPTTKQHVAQFLAHPSHAVLLVGSHGMGKTALAEALAAEILGLRKDKLATHAYFQRLQPDGDSISIAAIRDLQKFMQLKTIGDQPFRRAVIIKHAEALTTEAQNAYLKLLEEPPADTLMILTADNPRALLPTIQSRLQTITVRAPSGSELQQHFHDMQPDVTELTKAYFLSGGLPALMHALLTGDDTHPLAAAVNTAKTLLAAPAFERLALIEALAKQKDDARYVLEALQHIAQTGLTQAGSKGDSAKIKQWHHVLKVSNEAADALAQSANPKLVLTNFALQI
jgi:replication-associated recombination protein RarA